LGRPKSPNQVFGMGLVTMQLPKIEYEASIGKVLITESSIY